jgi:aminodeoxyfutalosine deaminase
LTVGDCDRYSKGPPGRAGKTARSQAEPGNENNESNRYLEVLTYTARWIFPVAGPPLERGTITVEGSSIAAVESHGTRTPDVDLGNCAIIPGLVNCHTHLDLSGARGKIPPTDADHFTDWLRGVIAYRKSRTPEQVQADIRDGLAECLRFGTTLLGDITSGGTSYQSVATSSIRAALFWEVIGLDEKQYWERVSEYGNACFSPWCGEASPPPKPATELCRWHLSPHAPYSVHHDAARQQLAFGGTSLHFAESPAEEELLSRRSGPFVAFLQELGVWKPEAITASFADFLWTQEKAWAPRLYIHGNYLPPDTEFHPSQTIIYCPRTHAAFRHPRHPFREFQSRGVRVALGTDSLASNPDLDLLAEARFVHRVRPEVPCEELLRMATLTGAEALGWANETGSLEIGKSADFVCVALPNGDGEPYRLLFEGAEPSPRRTLFRGQWRNTTSLRQPSPGLLGSWR